MLLLVISVLVIVGVLVIVVLAAQLSTFYNAHQSSLCQKWVRPHFEGGEGITFYKEPDSGIKYIVEQKV